MKRRLLHRALVWLSLLGWKLAASCSLRAAKYRPEPMHEKRWKAVYRDKSVN